MSRPSQPLSFRLATPEDAPHLSSLINAAFRSEKTGQTWLYDSQDKRVDLVNEKLISSFINGTDTIMLVGTTLDNPEPLATCYLCKPLESQPSHRTADAAWLSFLATIPTAHKQGYGLAMLREAERYVLEEWHVKRLEIDFVNARIQLRAWYEKCGYSATGQRRDFPYGENGRDILADGLDMIVLGKDLL